MPYDRDEPDPTPFDELGFPILIRRISCSLNSSSEVLFSFPLRYLFAIGCLLSYLALDGQHHLYSASTFKLTYSRNDPSLDPLTIAYNALCPGRSSQCCKLLHCRTIPSTTGPKGLGPEGFGLGLLPVRSQLLGESRLISFPPLTYMLKFSG